MKIPEGMSQDDVMKVFNEVVNKLTYKFKFGSYEADDIYQEAFIEALKGLEKYDGRGPLANFLYIHLRNRLINFKRKKYTRIESPCLTCPLKAYLPPDGCSAYEDKDDCNLFSGWIKRNHIKRNLTHTLEYNQVNAISERNMEYSNDMIENINSKEVLDLIDKELPVSLRKFYLQMLSGHKIYKKDRLAVEQAVIEILKKNNYEL